MCIWTRGSGTDGLNQDLRDVGIFRIGNRKAMKWLDKLENKRGSQPRCVLFMDSEREEVAARLTELVDLPDVLVSPTDTWMPRGKSAPTEAQLDKADGLLPHEIQQELGQWWLAVGVGKTKTPAWDIASRCNIKDRRGLILVEAKAHKTELKKEDKSGSTGANRNSIAQAFDEANCNLQSATEGSWNLSLTPRYQLSNRFAWSWKLASLGIPVVLVYLGFLNACDMDSPNTTLFHSKSKWENILKRYCKDTIDNKRWGETLDIEGTPFIPLIRDYEQSFDPEKS